MAANPVGYSPYFVHTETHGLCDEWWCWWWIIACRFHIFWRLLSLLYSVTWLVEYIQPHHCAPTPPVSAMSCVRWAELHNSFCWKKGLVVDRAKKLLVTSSVHGRTVTDSGQGKHQPHHRGQSHKLFCFSSNIHQLLRSHVFVLCREAKPTKLLLAGKAVLCTIC